MSKNTIAHNINKTPRTEDVAMHENIDFAGLLLSEDLLTGLTCAGFQRPSPIQLKAIPMGRCGLDLIVQAKSGTGKTCVFAVIALESITLKSNLTQVLVLAPTREIAVQIWEVINSIGSNMTELRCYTFIGGLPIDEDKKKLKKCHIAVGTPGRIKQLLEEKLLCPDSLRLFVLDEADKLLEDSFKDTVNWIYSVLPQNKQMLALSATYPESLALHLTSYMRNPTFIRLNSSDPALLGIRQYYLRVPFHPIPQMVFDNKTKALLRLLSSITFSQCLVFSNYQTRAQSLCNQLTSKGWPTTFINGAQNQQHRLTAMAKLKKYKCRVLVTTDLTARGIDAENVNLVINLDVPKDHETYLHRIGRAGRFGTYGAGITLCCEGLESDQLCDIQDKCCTDILMLPDPIPTDLAKASGFVNLDHLITTEQLSEHHPKPSENENQPELAQKDEILDVAVTIPRPSTEVTLMLDVAVAPSLTSGLPIEQQVDGRLKRTSNGNTKSKSDFERSSKKSNEETSGSVAHAQAEEYSVHNVQNIGIQNTNIAVNSPKQAFKNMPSIEKRAQSFLTFEKIKEAQERKTEIVIFPESHFDSPNLSAVAKMLNDLHFEQQVSASKMTNSKEPKALKHDQIINESYETKNDGVASQIRNGVKVKSYKVRNSNRLHKEDISLGMEYVDMLGSKDIQSESESETGSDSCNDNSESESCPQREEESDFISIKERKKSSRIRNISHRSQEVIEQDNYVYADDEREDENVSSYPNIAWTTVDKGNSNANLPVEEYAGDQGDAQNSVNRSDMFKKYFDDYDENCQNQLYLHVEADKLSESCPQREEESDFLELDHRKRVSSRKQNAPRRHHRSGAEKYAYADDEREDSAEVEKEKTKFVEMETQKIESSDEESEESHKEKMTYPSYNPFDPRIPNYPRSEQDMYQSVWGRSYMQQWTSMYQSYLYQQYILYSHQAEYFKQLYQQSKQSQNLCEIYKKQKSYMDYMVRKTMKKR